MTDKDYTDSYSDQNFWDKITQMPETAGCSVLRAAFTLYVLLKDSSTPLSHDSHWDELEMTLYIFGAGGADIECPVYEVPVDTEVLLVEQNGLQGISCQKFAALFAEYLINEISSRNIPVICNEGDKTEKYFDLAAPGNDILLPMIR
nr:hypothetical protein [uncultured Desulfobacter sp.]